MRPTTVLAADSDMAAIRKAAEAGRDASLKRSRDWIALPSIAAENRGMNEGAEYMAELARDAGFQHVEIVPTEGHPGVFATLDAGASGEPGREGSRTVSSPARASSRDQEATSSSSVSRISWSFSPGRRPVKTMSIES